MGLAGVLNREGCGGKAEYVMEALDFVRGISRAIKKDIESDKMEGGAPGAVVWGQLYNNSTLKFLVKPLQNAFLSIAQCSRESVQPLSF